MKTVALYRYPVKGLTGEALESATLTVDETLPFDRAYAIENGPGPFEPARPAHLPKIHFLMLMRNEQLAALECHFDDANHTLSIAHEGQEKARGDLRTATGRTAIEDFFVRYMPEASLRGRPRVVSAPGHSFSDVKEKCLHIVNLESVRALSTIIGSEVDPMRFRANVLIDGTPAWSEFDHIGKQLKLGSAVAEVFERTERCAATTVNPATAARDLKIPSVLSRTLGHTDFGVYARVIGGGPIAVGDAISLHDPALSRS